MFWFFVRFVLFTSISFGSGLIAEQAGYNYYAGMFAGLGVAFLTYILGLFEGQFN